MKTAGISRRPATRAQRRREPETDLTLDTIEQIDALERAGGGKWRESRTLAPGELVIEDARLT